MDELIKQVSEKAGISEDQARTAITTVVTFLKSRLPEPIASQLDSFTGGESAGGGDLSDMASKVGGLFK